MSTADNMLLLFLQMSLKEYRMKDEIKIENGFKSRMYKVSRERGFRQNTTCY